MTDPLGVHAPRGDRYCYMCAELDRRLFTGAGEGKPRGLQ